MKVETDVIASIPSSLIEQAAILMIVYVDSIKTNVIAVMGNIIMCLMSNWHINTEFSNYIYKLQDTYMQFFQKFVSIATSTFASTIYLHGIFQSIIKYILSYYIVSTSSYVYVDIILK